jgi:hypothetical protein
VPCDADPMVPARSPSAMSTARRRTGGDHGGDHMRRV